MHSLHKTLLAASAVCVIASAPALAQNTGNNGNGRGGCGNGQTTNGCPNSRGVPGPIAGAGLPFLLLAGGYALVRRYRKHNLAE